MIEREAAWASLYDPATTPAALAEVAAAYPEFAEAVAAHPHAYAELREWAASLAEPVIPMPAVSESPAVFESPSAVASSPTPAALALPVAASANPVSSEPSSPADAVRAAAPSRPSGWEVADKVAHGAGRVLHGTAWTLVKLWGALLLVVGIILLFALPASWWAALLIIAYAIYLLLPGSKWVIW